ncbi:hypothetical protein ACF068_07295 [Streptomyces sp. NPDC016309]|uniref:hypothetical protein n=1 Tax=Streptomyces sp. NPDC016309 TaxID=3364965 RepID=UPI0036F564F3
MVAQTAYATTAKSDEITGELRDTVWRGWINDDPYRPTWPDDGTNARAGVRMIPSAGRARPCVVGSWMRDSSAFTKAGTRGPVAVWATFNRLPVQAGQAVEPVTVARRRGKGPAGGARTPPRSQQAIT